MRVFGMLLVATLAVAAGSWVGLGRPDLRAPSAPAPLPEAKPIADDPPLPQPNVPSVAPWPRTNAEASIAKAWSVAHGRAKKAGDARRLVTFTFDDGPTPETTPAILRLLARHHVHATFFVIGSYLEGEKNRAKVSRHILKKTIAGGHLVGNHTHDHANLAALSPAEVIDQIDRGAASIERIS